MKCLILGIGGQDGSYLADILLEQGHEVYGLVRHSSADNLWRVRHCLDSLHLVQGDVTDQTLVPRVIDDLLPDEVYNVADQDHVEYSYSNPMISWDVTARAAVGVMEAIRRYSPASRMYQPCSATVFGHAPYPQNESTTFNPLSPYACAKAAAYYATRYYREVCGVGVCQAILYNHDSPRRGPGYLLQEIARKAVDCFFNHSTEMLLGDPSCIVDVGYARDYMEAVVTMMRLSEPDDFVLSSGNARPIRFIAQKALEIVGVDVPINADLDFNFKRPDSRSRLVGDSTKAAMLFGFNPKSTWEVVLRMIIDRMLRSE
jgi:GDPmannose 4,6-dehydratase